MTIVYKHNNNLFVKFGLSTIIMLKKLNKTLLYNVLINQIYSYNYYKNFIEDEGLNNDKYVASTLYFDYDPVLEKIKKFVYALEMEKIRKRDLIQFNYILYDINSNMESLCYKN